MFHGVMLRSSFLGVLLTVTACGLSLPAPTPPITMTKEAPPGTFTSATTFELAASFETWAVNDVERQAKYKSSLEHGITKAENRAQRQWFITNPRLANRNAPPAFVIEVVAHEVDTRGAFLGSGASVRIKRGAEVVEAVDVNASASKGGSDAQGDLAVELGEMIGRYVVCRTGERPQQCR